MADHKECAEVADASLNALRTNYADLKREVSETENGELSAEDVAQRALLFAERITQDLVSIDAVDISKTKASEALHARDRKTAQKLSLLLARRKNLIRDLHLLSERVEILRGGGDAN